MKTRIIALILGLFLVLLLSSCQRASDEVRSNVETSEVAILNIEENKNFVSPVSDLAIFIDSISYNQIFSGTVSAVDKATITLSKDGKQLTLFKSPQTEYFDATGPNQRTGVDKQFLKAGQEVLILVEINPGTAETKRMVVNIVS